MQVLVRGPEMLLEARAQARAIPAFTSYTLESTRAVVEAAACLRSPVIVQAGSGSFRGSSREMLAAAVLAAARAADAAVGVHLDHATQLPEVRACIELGYSSVMIDGSRLDFESNVALSSRVVAESHAAGVWVEAELGAIAGDEDVSASTGRGELTAPWRAEEFVERTGVDALAVAIGTVHGIPDRPVVLDLGLLEQIRALVPVPLVIHGASGVDTEQLLAAVALGVAKVNYNAELRRAYIGALRTALIQDSDDVVAVQLAAVAAMAAVARDKLLLLGGGHVDVSSNHHRDQKGPS
jgi:ketose-bisphosphate aldolase